MESTGVAVRYIDTEGVTKEVVYRGARREQFDLIRGWVAIDFSDFYKGVGIRVVPSDYSIRDSRTVSI